MYYTEGGLTSVVLPRALGAWLNKAGLIGWVGSKVINLGELRATMSEVSALTLSV